MLQAAQDIDGRVLWANLHLLFWLSLCRSQPGGSESIPRRHTTAIYGGVFLMAGVAWLLLQDALVKRNGSDSLLAPCRRAGPEGQAYRRCSMLRDPAGLRQGLDGRRGLCAGRPDVVRSRSAHRAAASIPSVAPDQHAAALGRGHPLDMRVAGV